MKIGDTVTFIVDNEMKNNPYVWVNRPTTTGIIIGTRYSEVFNETLYELDTTHGHWREQDLKLA